MTDELRTDGSSAEISGKAPEVPDATQSLVEQIAKALVDHPEAVEVQAVVRDESTVLRLHVSDADIGKVIGKQGRTAHSLRTILSAVSMKYHHRYTLDIVETSASHSAGMHGLASHDAGSHDAGSHDAGSHGAIAESSKGASPSTPPESPS